MKITKDKIVRDIQNTFSEQFPYLKIKFYKIAHDHFHGSQKKDEVEETVSLVELNPDLKEGTIEIVKELSVDSLETMFEEIYGLHIQVFRKSGDQWLQTSVTDHWTLEKHTQSAMENEKFATR